MKRSYVFSFTVLLASCSPKVAAPLKNCAIPPSYYKRYGDPPSVSGGPIPIMPINNAIYVPTAPGRLDMHDRDEVEWNGTPVSLAMVDTYLQTVREMNPQPSTVIDFPVGAPCKTVLEVRALMEKHLNCRNSYGCYQGFSADYNPTPEPQPTPH
jgi:hypothetical protein